jgi:hypothetical protein
MVTPYPRGQEMTDRRRAEAEAAAMVVVNHIAQSDPKRGDCYRVELTADGSASKPAVAMHTVGEVGGTDTSVPDAFRALLDRTDRFVVRFNMDDHGVEPGWQRTQ